MKVQFKGICESVWTDKAKNVEGFIQKILIKIPERLDDFGDPVSKETFYEVGYFNKDIEKLISDTEFPGKRVEVEAYLNSNYYKSPDGKETYILNLNLKSIKEYVR